MLDASPTNNQRRKMFSFAQLTLSDDEGSRDDGNTSAVVTPHTLEMHAAEAQRELDTHRERLRKRSAAHLNAEQHRLVEESELQQTISKLMRELSDAHDSVQREISARTQVEKNFRVLQAEHRITVDALAACKRREALAGNASPLLSPVVGSPGHMPLIRVDGQMPVASFRLVKKSSSAAQHQQQTAIVSLLCSVESHARASIEDIVQLHHRMVRTLWSRLALQHVQMLHEAAGYVAHLESSERIALTTHEAKLRYKAICRLRAQENDLLHRIVTQQKMQILSHKADTVRNLQDEMLSETSSTLPVVVAAPAPKTPPWYPAGTTSINYHSPQRHRSPSAPSRSATPSLPASAAQSLTSPPDYSRIPPKVVTTWEKRSVSPVLTSQHRHSAASRMHEPSPNMTPPTPHRAPFRQPSPSRQPPSTARHTDSSAKVSSVKRTIETMEALLEELQSWKSARR
jgi:hypothetical protein